MARMINRRNLMKSGICLTSGLAGAGTGFPTVVHGVPDAQPFNLNYAPHFGMFRHAGGEDLIGQLEFAAEQGFTAWGETGCASGLSLISFNSGGVARGVAGIAGQAASLVRKDTFRRSWLDDLFRCKLETGSHSLC